MGAVRDSSHAKLRHDADSVRTCDRQFVFRPRSRVVAASKLYHASMLYHINNTLYISIDSYLNKSSL